MALVRASLTCTEGSCSWILPISLMSSWCRWRPDARHEEPSPVLKTRDRLNTGAEPRQHWQSKDLWKQLLQMIPLNSQHMRRQCMIKPHGYFRIICAVFITFNFPVYCATRLVSIVLPQDEADDHIYTMNFYIGPMFFEKKWGEHFLPCFYSYLRPLNNTYWISLSKISRLGLGNMAKNIITTSVHINNHNILFFFYH